MNAPAAMTAGRGFRRKLMARGYQVLFHAEAVNHCPGCGGTHWYVGRVTAECGRCGTALPLAEAALAGLDPVGRCRVALHLMDDGRFRRERRRGKREAAQGRVVTLHVDGAPRAFALDDISDGGVRGVAIDGVARGRKLIVELEDGTLLPAELRWSSDSHVGLAFVEPGKA